MSRAPSNPFYAGGPAPPSGGSSNAPPPYSTSTRPVPAIPSEPVTYTSLSDLTRGKQQKPTANTFSYEPSSQRAGYREGGPVQNETFGTGQGARRTLPPDPQAGRERSLVPPKRTVAAPVPPPAPAGAPANQSYWQKAQGYVPNSVSATAMSAGDRVKSGADSVFTQQNRDAAMGGLARAAGGAAKLAGKGAWKLGKFASSGGKPT